MLTCIFSLLFLGVQGAFQRESRLRGRRVEGRRLRTHFIQNVEQRKSQKQEEVKHAKDLI